MTLPGEPNNSPNSPRTLRRLVILQVVVSVAALAVIVVAALQFGPLLEKKRDLEANITELGIQERVLQGNVRELVARLEILRTSGVSSPTATPAPTAIPGLSPEELERFRRQQSQDLKPTARFIKPVLKAEAVAGEMDSRRRQLYDFTFSMAGTDTDLDRIERVSYKFDHPSFIDKTQETTNRASAYAVKYRGWGCLSLVIIDVIFDDGADSVFYFEMCNEWTKQK